MTFFSSRKNQTITGDVKQDFYNLGMDINYDGKRGALIGKESKKTLEEGNKVRARIVALSLKGKSSKETKIGLTMRQPNLGRVEWIEAEKEKRAKKGKGKKEKK